MPRMSLSFMIRSSSPSSVISVPDHLPNRILSPALDIHLDALAVVVLCPSANGHDLALSGLLLGVVGDDQAAGGLFVAFHATNKNAIMKRGEFHVERSFVPFIVFLLALETGEC